MPLAAGANAKNPSGLALAREMRSAREAAGIAPKQLVVSTKVDRAKIDALELGDYADIRSPKRTARLARDEFIRVAAALNLDRPSCDALLVLAARIGALRRGSSRATIRDREWEASGRQVDSAPTSVGDAEALAGMITAKHAEAFVPHEATPVQRWSLPSPRCRRFYGRHRLVQELASKILGSDGVIFLVYGAAGVGKSEVVREALDRPDIRGSFADLLWLSGREAEFIRGPSPSRRERSSSRALLRELADGLRVTENDLATELAARRWLVVIDNTETVTDQQILLSRLSKLHRRNTFVVTTRDRLDASFLTRVPENGVPGLDREEISEFVQGEVRARMGSGELDRLTAITGGATLALHWFAGRSDEVGVDAAIRELETGAAQELNSFLFDKQWELTDAGARDALDFLAHHVTEPVPVAVLDHSGVANGRASASVSQASLRLIERGPLGIGLHPLTAAFVRHRMASASRWRDAPAWRAGLRYFSESAGAATPTELGALRNYVDWLAAAVSAGAASESIIGWMDLSRHLWDRFEWSLYGRCTRLAHAAAKLAPEPAAVLLAGLAASDEAWLLMEQRGYDDALASARRAIRAFSTLGDDAGLALAHRYAGAIALRSGRADRLKTAMRHLERAREAARRGAGGGPRRGRIRVAIHQLTEIGVWDVVRGGYSSYRGDWKVVEALILELLGTVQMKLGRDDAAERALTSSVELFSASPGRAGSEAGPMISLAELQLLRGRRRTAMETLRTAAARARAGSRLELLGPALMQLAAIEARTDLAAALADASDARHAFLGTNQDAAVARADALLGVLRTLTQQPPAQRKRRR